MIIKNTLAILSSAFLIACSSSVKNLTIYQEPPFEQIQQQFPDNGLSIQYLGVGGHLFKFGDKALLTAPSITNPHFLALGPFMPISADKEMIERLMPDVSKVETILVGHAHYDHLMDVPYVMLNQAKDSHVYGSKTMSHSIAPVIDASRRHALNDTMAIKDQPGQWHYNDSRTIRFMAIKSTHAPHLMGINIMTGSYDEDLTDLPWHAFGWKEGQTLSYLIDFLGSNEQILHRVYYQDAANQEPLGLIPQLPTGDRKQIDIAIITPASFSQVDNYPESIMASTQAKHFILGHWEDFFANHSSTESPAANEALEHRFVRSVSSSDFFERFETALPKKSSWAMPRIYHTQYFAPDGQLIMPTAAEPNTITTNSN